MRLFRKILVKLTSSPPVIIQQYSFSERVCSACQGGTRIDNFGAKNNKRCIEAGVSRY